MNEIEELFPFYALGVLSFEEKAQVEAYVAKDASAKARLEEMITTARGLPYEAIPIPPSQSVKTTLMARVHADSVKNQVKAEQPVPKTKDWLQILRDWLVSPVFSATAIAAIVLMGVWVSNLQTNVENLASENTALQGEVISLSEVNNELQTHLTDLEQENSLLREAILDDEELIALFTDPDRQEIAISGTDQQPDAQGTLLVSETANANKAVLIVSSLPALPEGMTYQFWLIGDEGAIGAGLFHSNAQGHGVLIINSEVGPVMNFDAIGVSVEPEGGSQQPTGAIVLLGNL